MLLVAEQKIVCLHVNIYVNTIQAYEFENNKQQN
jgi:hypothetical protein